MSKVLFIIFSFALFVFTGCSSKNEMTVINENGKYGALENDDKVIIKPIYDGLSNFDDSENKNIKADHPHVFNLHWIHNYSGNEYAIAEYREKYGIVNSQNELVVKPTYDHIKKLFNGFMIVEVNGKYGLLNDKFELVLKPIFNEIREFLANASFVKNSSNNWNCITKDLKINMSDEFSEVYTFNEGLARVVKDGKWGFVNESCKEIIKAEFDYVDDFFEGYAKVIKDSKTSYVDKEGKIFSKEVYLKKLKYN